MSFTTFQTLVSCVECDDMTWRAACTWPWPAADRTRLWDMVEKMGRGFNSSTFRLNVSTICGMRWVHDFPPVY